MTKKITYKGESKTLEYYKGMPWERELTKAMKVKTQYIEELLLEVLNFGCIGNPSRN